MSATRSGLLWARLRSLPYALAAGYLWWISPGYTHQGLLPARPLYYLGALAFMALMSAAVLGADRPYGKGMAMVVTLAILATAGAMGVGLFPAPRAGPALPRVAIMAVSCVLFVPLVIWLGASLIRERRAAPGSGTTT